MHMHTSARERERERGKLRKEVWRDAVLHMNILNRIFIQNTWQFSVNLLSVRRVNEGILCTLCTYRHKIRIVCVSFYTFSKLYRMRAYETLARIRFMCAAWLGDNAEI